MTREAISKLSNIDLLHLCELFDLDGCPDDPEDLDLTRFEVEGALFDVIEEVRQERINSNASPVNYQERKYLAVEDLIPQNEEELPKDEFEFPDQYNITRIRLMLRDPEWAFAYWDISMQDRTKVFQDLNFVGLKLVLKQIEPIRKLDKSKNQKNLDTMEIPINISDSHWYINIEDKKASYQINLIAEYHDHEEMLAQSGVIYIPQGGFSHKINMIDSFSTDAILSLSGLENLGIPSYGQDIPHRILKLVENEEK